MKKNQDVFISILFPTHTHKDRSTEMAAGFLHELGWENIDG